jgi:hypothetical protein
MTLLTAALLVSFFHGLFPFVELSSGIDRAVAVMVVAKAQRVEGLDCFFALPSLFLPLYYG